MTPAAPDWTEVWVQAAPLSPAEVLLSLLLVSASLLLESLSLVLHHFRDTYSEIDPSIVKTDPEPLEKTAKYGYNFESYFLPLTSKPGRPLLHYLDVGLKNASNVLVLLHGEPFWSFVWTKVIPGLSADHRVIVPDLIGFGKSDKYVDWRMYDLDLHLESVIRLMDHLDIDGLGHEVTLVGHDWGWGRGFSKSI